MGKSAEIEIIARGVLCKGGKILLCQNLARGYYYLPGGHVEFGEGAKPALARELKEECGLTIQATQLGLICEEAFHDGGKSRQEINLVFHMEHVPAGASKQDRPASLKDLQSLEADIGFTWVDLAAVPDLDIRPPSIKAWLASGMHKANGAEWVSSIL